MRQVLGGQTGSGLPASPAVALPTRIVTAASLFDGHDAAIHVMRRLLQARGAEIIHLGHNRSVAELVAAAVQEDADALAVSSYQGGHNEFFPFLLESLRAAGAAHVQVVVGGGGTIAPAEAAALERAGVAHVYTPADGQRLGLEGMIDDVLARVRATPRARYRFEPVRAAEPLGVARAISALERAAGGDLSDGPQLAQLRHALAAAPRRAPVIGLTGPGGAGKSSLADELLLRFVRAHPERRFAVVAIDPTRRRSGGALLGDRIRMNVLGSGQVTMRSLATRREHASTSAVLPEVVALLQWAGFDLILVETAGSGQADSQVVDLVDLALYVMTAEFGAPSQLEKIDMLELAQFVVLNKAEKRGSADALAQVRRQWRRNHREQMSLPDEQLPVHATMASRFDDPGVTGLAAAIGRWLDARAARGGGWAGQSWAMPAATLPAAPPVPALIPPLRSLYLAEIAARGRAAAASAQQSAQAAHRAGGLHEALAALGDPALPPAVQAADESADTGLVDAAALRALRRHYNAALAAIPVADCEALRAWPARANGIAAADHTYVVRGQPVSGSNYVVTPGGTSVPKVAAPALRDWGDLLQFLLAENLPGAFPYTAGVYPFRREQEEPLRMFAGEGGPERTNRRFHYLARGRAAQRLSTAFDSTTLYGEDPALRPDVFGRTGNAGVSIATLDDMKRLYSGFDLCAPTTSVSMTINGPAPMILAMFLNTAIDQRVERWLRAEGRWGEAERRIAELRAAQPAGLWPAYRGELPPGHDGSGLGLLGVTGDALVDAATYARLEAEALAAVRGTVQADILKEEQAQNTCIFSLEFALRMMGDVQEYFSRNGVRNFYSASVSGYHIAEAGANPVTQLAFTLANGFTLVEYYRARGLAVDDFAPNLSFFFSNGMDAEYSVLGRVARRIWARAMRDLYGAGARSQMLKYHIQTSGRSLHAREIEFNDIRTTLQALEAVFDNCNSLHTNAYDEALTTPGEASVRRAVAIQLIIQRELGLAASENPWQGSWFIGQLTDLVEAAVYREFEALSERGGVLGAMETGYQRSRIQEESLAYERRKHDGSLPIVGINTYLYEGEAAPADAPPPLFRAPREEQLAQVEGVAQFQQRHAAAAGEALARLQQVAREGGNVFAELLASVRCCSLGQLTQSLYQAGGRYRRSL
jgi:methylmalonyl-CoA mutase